MIVSCPACSARYRIDPDKIKGRGAKITCPRCSHKFVVYKDGADAPPAKPAPARSGTSSDILDRDFRRVGVTWRVRQGMGVTYSFHDLRSLLRTLEEGRIAGSDSLSYDSHTWVPLDSIDSLEDYFRDIWRKGARGEIGMQRHGSSTPVADEEEEGPTTIMGHGHALMDDIRRAVAEATTPPPSSPRQSGARPPRAQPTESAFDDPTTFSRRTPMPSDRTDTNSEGPTRIGPMPQLGYVPRQRPTSPASDHAARPPAKAPTRKPEPPAPPPRADQDNQTVLLLALGGLVIVVFALLGSLWYLDVVQFSARSSAPPAAESSAPAQPAPAPAPAPTDDTDTDTDDSDPAAPTDRQPKPSQLIPGNVEDASP